MLALHGRARLAGALAGCALLAGGAASGLLLAGSAPPAGAAGRSVAGGPAAPASGATVTVTATGQAAGTPDTMTLQMGVSSTAASAASALDDNDREMSTLQATFSGAGVPSSDIQTSGLDLQPNYGSGDRIVGYEADDELTVTLTDLSAAGTVIDAAAHAVGNDVRIDGVSFSISDTSALLASARRRAMANAAAEAGDLSTAAGDHLGGVVKIVDQSEQLPTPQPFGFAAASAPARAPVPVQAGSAQLSVQVEVVYDLES